MKYISIAILALITQTKAYAESEGPTKVDLGEDDEKVLPRELDIKGHWVNPLSLSDRGDDDDVVLIQNGAQIRIKAD